MAKKVAAKITKAGITRASSKQKFHEYRGLALKYISQLRNPFLQPAFFMKAYDVTPTGKKPNNLSAPELLAIVATAKKLGKTVTISVQGMGDTAQLEFHFMDDCPNIPAELLY